MTRAIIKFKDGSHLNLPADYIAVQDEWAMAWNGEQMVMMSRLEDVACFYLSKKNDVAEVLK